MYPKRLSVIEFYVKKIDKPLLDVQHITSHPLRLMLSATKSKRSDKNCLGFLNVHPGFEINNFKYTPDTTNSFVVISCIVSESFHKIFGFSFCDK